MASETGSYSFVRAWHFVNSADKNSKTTCRFHAVRETARRRSQTCDSDSESDNDGPNSAESNNASDTISLSQIKFENYKSFVFRSKRQFLRPIKGNQHL
jgi:hypothetical protein